MVGDVATCRAIVDSWAMGAESSIAGSDLERVFYFSSVLVVCQTAASGTFEPTKISTGLGSGSCCVVCHLVPCDL